MPRDEVVDDEEVEVEVGADAAAAAASPAAGATAATASPDVNELWEVFHDDSGVPFFTNRVTGESVWDKPEGFRSVPLCFLGVWA